MVFPKLWTKNLLLLFFGLGVSLILSEICLHLIGFSNMNFSRWDPNLGSSLVPNLEGWVTKEGKAYIRINSAGFRDREHPLLKPEKTLRIAVLGDSYAEAMQVPMEKTFWSIMEKELEECQIINGKNIEVLNFGVSGFGTDQELLTLRHKVWNYNPDIVLLAFLAGNDIRDNSYHLSPKYNVPFFYYKDGQLTLDDSFKKSKYFLTRQKWHYKFLYWIYNRSKVLQVINKFRSSLKNRNLLEKNKLRELGLDELIYQIPEGKAWKEAWRITEDLLVLMRDEVQQKKAKFMVVTLTVGKQVHPSKSRSQEFMKKLGVKNLFYPDFRIKELGKKKNFPVLNLAPAFQAYAEKNQKFLHGFVDRNLGKGHWNSEGHRLAGKMITGYICKNLSR